MKKNNKATSVYPDKKGLYVCLVDGNERILHHHYCCNNGRHWWTDTAGYDVVGNVQVVRSFVVQK